MTNEGHSPEDRASTRKRALRAAAGPFVGYFGRRFQDVHKHLDELPFDRLESLLRQELTQTRADVAADTDTIAELSFTLERFADLFIARMEQLADQFAGAAHAPSSKIVELPFAFSAVADLERGAAVATVADDGSLSIGLSALGLHVTALDPAGTIIHPDVAVVEERVDDWAGPAQPLDAVLTLTTSTQSDAERQTVRDMLDRFHKWLRPTGLLVLAIRLEPERGSRQEQLDDLLTDWDVEREAHFEQEAHESWRRTADVPAAGVTVLRAAPRA